MRVFLVLLLSVFTLFACQNSGDTTTSTVTMPSLETEEAVAYQMEDIPGSSAQIAKHFSDDGDLLEFGTMVGGKKNGTWTYYAPDADFPIKVISFVDDMYTGTYMEFNERGQAELLATYKNNKLDGPWGKFRFGRPEMTANYKGGELDGIRREYDFRNGNLLKEASFKAGQLDGLVRDYDEEGRVMVEYMYRDGEKISGGVVERE
ncbi:MAG: hypothetical protein AAFO03_03790 [Bacteroidota bacterium]